MVFDPPVASSNDLGIGALGAGLVENAQGTCNCRLAGQDTTIIGGDVIRQACGVALSISDALAANLGGTESGLETAAKSRADGRSLVGD